MSGLTRFCTQCGHGLERDDRYCGSCGSPTRDVSGAPAELVSAATGRALETAKVDIHPTGPMSLWDRVYGEGQAAETAKVARPPQPGARTNGMAVVAFVLALVGLGIGSILAIVLGYQAQRDIDNSGGTQTGRALATAGIVIGWISLGVWVLILGIATTS
jgi:Domain of unknown function (DUF4190)